VFCTSRGLAARRLAAALAALAAVLGLATVLAPGASAAGGRGHKLKALGLGRPLYADGQAGRYLLGGRWLYRGDPLDVGVKSGYQRDASTSGWLGVHVPNAWNATDTSELSMNGSIGWYRRDFKAPSRSRALTWLVRFESVNYRAQVWLNGRSLGTHSGAFLPWELELEGLRRKGTNHLVIRVDSRHTETDLPPNKDAGWWNYGGLLREVYLRRVRGLDIARADVRPTIRCAKCAASIPVAAVVRSYAARTKRIHVTGTYGKRRLDLGTRTVAPGDSVTFRDTIHLPKPKLWSPKRPYLYRVHLQAGPARFDLHSGVRAITVRKGRLYLNYKPLHFRGVGLHEDSPTRGAAIGLDERKQILGWIRDLGATFVRAHYPLSPEFEEIADHHGILLWSEVPMYHMPEKLLARTSVQDAGLRMIQGNIEANGDHPSIIAWSIGNEQDSTTGPGQVAYNSRAGGLIHRLDPTRPAAYAFASHPSSGCQTDAYRELDLLGINDYFGWYTAAGTIADRDLLSNYLDSIRACYPKQALAVSEFGAEADRHGPVEEKGTYEFQDDFTRFHLGVYATKPWLAGVTYWALQEFRVSPGWGGGNPRPNSPIHEKGLVTFLGDVEKPAYATVRGLYRATRQYGRWRPLNGLK
jgi:beta-glucuronidase